MVPVIVAKKRKLLLKYFNDIDSISRAKPEELALVPGISNSLARDILMFFIQEQEKMDDQEADNG